MTMTLMPTKEWNWITRVLPPLPAKSLEARAGKNLTTLFTVACFLGVVLLTFVPSGLAQSSVSAGLSGTVTDPSGGAVPGARVSATNAATNVATAATTDSRGFYSFPSLQLGDYVVKVEKEGFETLIQSNVTLHAGVMQQLSVELKVGSLSQEVTVTGAPPALDTNSASLAQLIPTQAITSLPLLGLLPYDLLGVAPGVTGTGTLGGTANTTNDVIANGQYLNINAGGRSYESNLFNINGSNTTDSPVGGSAAAGVLPDALAEMRVSTNDYDAQYGGQAGMIVNSSTKTGANQLHGDAFEYHMDSALSSRNVFQSSPSSLYPWRRNEFGGTIGGAILKDRLFFFGSIDVLKTNGASSGLYNFETPAFASFVETNFPNSIAAGLLKNYTPATGVGGSAIPLSNLQTLSQYYSFAPGYYFPTLSSAEALGFSADLPVMGTGVWTPKGTRHGYNFSVRPDYYFNQQKDHLFYFLQRSDDVRANEDPRPAFEGTGTYFTDAMNLNEIHTFSPNLINESVLGYYRTFGGETAPASALNIPGVAVGGIDGWNGGGYPFVPANYVQNVTNWNDMLTLMKGSHTLKMGYGIRRWEDNANFTGPYTLPYYYMANLVDFSQDVPYQSTEQGVDPQTGQPTSQVRGYRATENDLFLNDSWKVKSNLTISLGLRWDYFGNPREATGKQENFILGSGSSLAQEVANGSAQVVPVLYHNARHDNFSPRIGFSWNPAFAKKLVLRGGFGTFYDRPSNQIYTNNRANMPLFAVPTFGVPTGTSVTYGLCKATTTYNVSCPENPLLSEVKVNSVGGLEVPIGGVETLIPTTQYGTSAQFPVAYSENWNLGVQYSFTPSLVGEVDYIADVSRHNYMSTDVNRVDGDNVHGLLERPNPNFADIEFSQPIANSNFNALSVGLRRNASHGVILAAYYTWSHALDYCSNYLEGACAIPDISNIRANYGPSDFDVHSHFAAYATWAVPVVFSSNAALSRVVSHWTLSPVITLQSGMPFSVTCNGGYTAGCDYNLDGYGTDRPNVVGPVHFASNYPNRHSFETGIFQSGPGQFGTQFYAPSGVQEGNLARNSFRGPGLADIDFALSRRFRMSERFGLELGGQAFNLFNRVNLGGPDGGMVDPTFGLSTGILGNPRTFQVYAKVHF
jgi:hypothetical protein